MEPEQESQEGQRPARRLTSRIFLYLGVIGVVVIVVLAGWVVLVNKSEPEPVIGITAKDAKTIADEVAKNWSTNATCIDVRGWANKNDIIYHWEFFYIKPPYYDGEYNVIEIYGDGNIENNSGLSINGFTTTKNIDNFTINSDEAYNIAIGNETIKTFIDEHNATLGICSLSNLPTGNLTWEFRWSYDRPGDPYQTIIAQIVFDANTGEIKSVFIPPYE